MRFRTRTGVPWRDAPERYGPWARVYDLFRRRQRDGTWQRTFAALQAQADAKELITWGPRRRLHRVPGPPGRSRGAEERGAAARGRPTGTVWAGDRERRRVRRDARGGHLCRQARAGHRDAARCRRRGLPLAAEQPRGFSPLGSRVPGVH
ncbi:transposase [Streptomyces sp. NPDC059169]|uniref:transposase n=1 Tax=Streptomyces sp. NPDC059169 TaxID=3346754 RepID=UPI00368DFE2B